MARDFFQDFTVYSLIRKFPTLWNPKVSSLTPFQTRVTSKKFVSQREEVIGEWRTLHNKELQYLYSSYNNIWIIGTR